MRRSPGCEDDQLRKQFHHLQQDWNYYKQSVPRLRRSSSVSTATSATAAAAPEFLRLLHDSPKKLVSSLQQARPPSAQSRAMTARGPVDDDDTAAAAAADERKWAAGSGRLRGRSLLEALETAKDGAGQAGPHGREEVCSVCSSVLIQEAHELDSSSCSCCSSSVDGGHKRDRNARYIRSSSPSSSYIEASLETKVAEEEEVVSERNEKQSIRSDENDNNNNNNNNDSYGEKWVVRAGWFAIALVVLAFGLISYVEFGAEESTVEYLIPT